MLIEKIKADWKAARIARNAVPATLLGTLVGAIQSKEKTFTPERSLTDIEIVAQIKKMLDALVETKGYIVGNPDRVAELEKTETEISVLTAYMPQQMDEAAVEAFMRQKLAAGGATMGSLMASLKEAFAGAYDGKVASSVAKRLIAEAVATES
jgi:uncharacterized protein YqeY